MADTRQNDFAPPPTSAADLPHDPGTGEDAALLERVLENAQGQARVPFVSAQEIVRYRDLLRVERSFIAEATLLGEDAFYAWGTGKDRVEGPSQELAHAAARCWGNCLVQTLPLEETETAWVITTQFVDLETGFNLSRPFRQSKRWTVFGRFDAERKDDIRFQIGASKSARNCILKAVPSWLVNRGLNAAKAGVKKKIEEMLKATGLQGTAAVEQLGARAIEALRKHGVTKETVLAKFGVADPKGFTIEHLVTMAGDVAALDNGRDYPDTLYPAAAATEPGLQKGAAGLAEKVGLDAGGSLFGADDKKGGKAPSKS